MTNEVELESRGIVLVGRQLLRYTPPVGSWRHIHSVDC